jgi:hypothetical protein
MKRKGESRGIIWHIEFEYDHGTIVVCSLGTFRVVNPWWRRLAREYVSDKYRPILKEL